MASRKGIVALRPHGATRGFSVIEILVAATIFSLVSTVVFMVFRGAVRSQEVGVRETEIMQRARYTMSSLQRDTTNIFFRDETSYNVTISRLIEQMESERIRAEQTGDWQPFFDMYGDPDDPRTREAAAVGNPWEQGRVIDLQFQGTPGSNTDTVSFAVYSPLRLGSHYNSWGLSRVTYRVDNSILLRIEEPVEVNPRNIYGEVLERRQPPRIAKLAEGVEEFKLRYAFWYDHQWYETSDWSSTRRQTRNPRFILGDHGIGDDMGLGFDALQQGRNDGQLRPGEPGWNEFLNDQRSEPLDRLPAYMRVHLGLTDPDDPGRIARFETVLRVYPSEETYAPMEELLDERQREYERRVRDERYTPIYPGSLVRR